MWIIRKRLLAKENSNIQRSIINTSAIDIEDSEINIRTNPSNILVVITTKKATSILLNIYNIFGASVYTATYSIANNVWQTTIDTSTFNKGTYMIQITMDNKITTRKINI